MDCDDRESRMMEYGTGRICYVDLPAYRYIPELAAVSLMAIIRMYKGTAIERCHSRESLTETLTRVPLLAIGWCKN